MIDEYEPEPEFDPKPSRLLKVHAGREFLSLFIIFVRQSHFVFDFGSCNRLQHFPNLDSKFPIENVTISAIIEAMIFFKLRINKPRSNGNPINCSISFCLLSFCSRNFINYSPSRSDSVSSSFLSYFQRQVFHSEKSPHGYRQELCPLPLHAQSSVCNPSSCSLCVDDCLPFVSAN